MTDPNEISSPTAVAVLTHVVRSIVDDPDAVNVAETEGRNRLRLEVKVGPGDLGRVIGRRGRTAQSIRTLVRAAAAKDGREVDVDVAGTAGGNGRIGHPVAVQGARCAADGYSMRQSVAARIDPDQPAGAPPRSCRCAASRAAGTRFMPWQYGQARTRFSLMAWFPS